jgi:hypothetical protein
MRIRKITFVWILLVAVLLSEGTGQTPDLKSKLSKKQMYKDFDEFVQIIDSSTQTLVRKIATGYDAAEEIRQRREKIKTIHSYGEFLEFLNGCLTLTMSVHAQMAANYEYREGRKYIDTLTVTPLYQAYNEYRNTLPVGYKSRPFGSGFYHNGSYYIYGNYTIFNRNTSDTIFLSDIRLLKHNDEPVGVLKNSQIKGRSHWFRWDHRLQQYYHVYAPFIPSSDKVLIENYPDKKIMEIERKIGKTYTIYDPGSLSKDILSSLPKGGVESDNMKVTYYDSLHLLYIYMGAMNDESEELANSIKKEGAGKQIDKIIWDVRNNLGGGDYAWATVLQAIIKKPLPIKGWISFRNTETMRKISEYYEKNCNPKNILKHKIPYLDNAEFITFINGGVTDEGDTICFVPDTNSLQYEGKIYILQNEFVFSAAGTLLATAKLYPQFVTVGVPTGLIMGRGVAPAIFQLPESKFTFIMEACVDLTDCQTALDVFHDRPQIEIYPTLEEIIDMNNYGAFLNKRGDEFLFKHDYLFKKVLEMK